jgi:predicted nucleic acid-binding protein
MIVVDTNLLIKLVLKQSDSSQAYAVYLRDSNWVMPELWQHEFLNVLANYLRFDNTPYDQLLQSWEKAIMLFADGAQPVNMPLALKIAGERNITAYDAQYLALAQTLGVPLITEDRKLRLAAPELTLSMQEFLAT